MKTTFLFQVWPYAAVALFCAGLVVRYLLLQNAMPAVRRRLTDHAAARGPVDKVLGLGVALLALAHVAALLLPRAVLRWDAVSWRLHLLEGIGFVLAFWAMAAWARALAHLLRRSTGDVMEELADAMFLSLLFVGIASGLLVALTHRWGSAWAAVTVTPYFGSLVRGAPATELVARLPFLVHVHVVSAFAALAVLPGTRLATAPLLAAHRVLDLAGRPMVAAAQSAEGWLRRRNPAAWLWSEPELRWVTKTADGREQQARAAEAAQRARRRREPEVRVHSTGSKL